MNDIDRDAVLSLAHSGRPKSYLTRLDNSERTELAEIWRKHQHKPEFNVAIKGFYADRAARLDSAKATEDDGEPVEPTVDDAQLDEANE